MSKYAVVNVNNVVENIIVWDGETPYEPGNNASLLNIEELHIGIGWELIDDEWVAPENPAEPVVDHVVVEDVPAVEETVEEETVVEEEAGE